ncbi:dimethyl sulfoxide reductase anchor subunit family protein [Shimia abyssi]|uniref:DMSO reductase anchor subunit n=1 Tax=Shimia abyssi TaxID=1662395 RepID=A0A2P8FAB0_9RHOB|nr:DmsC/YnfH family molybdoenzyme membrane anchor subunit [Shimia abyssi]PSL18671.1 DMSO reductase anchor subunit [Shimia abyssi]
MHPAPSVIAFTTLSGIGFGLLFWLGFDATPPKGMTAFIFFLIAFSLAVGGLISSTFHLGHPERAWRALTQWRTSWLSREGVCAIIALLVMGLYAAALIFLDSHLALLGWIGAILCMITVFTTSMIYAQLATIPRWNSNLTPALFLSLSLGGGALLSGRVTVALILLLIAGVVQLIWWKRGDTAFEDRGSTLGTATGLADRGTVRSMAHPHTAPNYLMREFIFVIGRKHALKLRIIALVLMIGLPVLCLILPFSHILAAVAVLSHLAGVAVSRWLFFAEAEHTVGLYYGMR